MLALALVLGGCTYERQEPGLFRPPPATPTSAATSLPPVQPTNPELPVAAETVWTSGEGLSVTSRFAVHAVRRVAGATVLDWSVTPLTAPGIASGDELPTWIDLGLSREGEGDVNIVLLDSAGREVYRPLSHRERGEFNHCLCSPLWVAQMSLRLGETRLLQLVFPELPDDVRFVDVALVNSVPFWHVPVTPEGQVPSATEPTDLARPAPAPGVTPPMTVFATFPGSRKRLQGVQIDEVVASPAWTAVRWTLHSVTDQPNFAVLPYGNPLTADPPPGIILTSGTGLSGPRLRPRAGADQPALRARFMTTRVRDRELYECLCSHLGLWAASLRQQGGKVSVVTTFPALPAGTRRVDLVLPTVGAVRNLAVATVTDVAPALGAPVGGESSPTWSYRVDDPPRGWSTGEWPTPLPSLRRLDDYRATVEDVVVLPGW